MPEEKSRKDILSENLKKYLDANGFTEKEAALKIGVCPTTFNSWTRRISYPRECNLSKMAEFFHIPTENLTESSLVADQRKRYLTIGASDVLNYYGTDKTFQKWCDLGLKFRREGRLERYFSELIKEK
ncbi:MAG TPA: helix-turn-helix transcriptional regulator [Lachnospiraceae bacterium]|nr:helix-turn-helix transcriptional regulator [Lachnospiraceae bacterium]